MIRKLSEQDRSSVLEYLYQEAAINIFIIGDIENFGFDTDFQSIYAEFIDNEYVSVVLHFKVNILYYSHKTYFNIEWLDFISQTPHEFVSGRKSLTDLILPHLKNTIEKPMYFCEVSMFNQEIVIDQNKIIDVKTEEDAALVFDLLKGINEFEGMAKQVKNDFVKSKMDAIKHSKAYYIIEDGICVSTVSTVADTQKSAMVVAVATHPKYRKKGYASKLMNKILHEYLINRKKTLCLFYDNPSAGAIYHRLGFVDIDKWVMLVRK